MPGYIATPRITNRLKRSNPADYDRRIDERRKAVPSGQLGTAWDVAYGALYLASDESRFVNATELIIDGGQTASTTGKVWED
jgi:NAD(P)-dependent dehydrogenase (short-subunit alcohol dehydrogenase family)